MAEFPYEGLKGTKRVKGRISARSRREVLSRLKVEGVVPLEVKEVKEGVPFWRSFPSSFCSSQLS